MNRSFHIGPAVALIAFALLSAGMLPSGETAADPPAPDAPRLPDPAPAAATPLGDEPRRPHLTPADSIRSETLIAEIETSWSEGRFADAIPLAEEIHRKWLDAQARASWDGDWWQTIDAGWRVELLRRGAAASPESQAELAPASEQEDRADALRRDGHPAEAEATYRSLLDIYARTIGADTPATIRLGNSLAQALIDQGRHEEAMPVISAALDRCRTIFGTETMHLATSLHTLATIHQSAGDYVEAERLERESLELRRKLLGSRDPSVAIALSGLGQILERLGRFADAEALHRESLDIRIRHYGPDDAIVATGWNNLGVALKAEGKYREAEPCLRRALDIRKETLGAGHPRIATALTNLAMLQRDRGSYSEALALQKDALEVARSSLGERHPGIVIQLTNLSALLVDYDDLAGALELLQRGLEIRRESLGDDHPGVALCLHNLAVTYEKQNDHATAESMLRQSIDIQRRLPETNPRLARSLSALAEILSAGGRHDDAEAAAREAVALSRTLLGPDHPMVIRALATLGETLRSAGRLEEAEATHIATLELRRRALGDSHPKVAESLAALARCRLERGEVDSAFVDGLAAEAIGVTHMRLMTSTLSEAAALRLATVRTDGIDVALSAVDRPRAPVGAVRAAWDAIIRSRALVLDEMAERRQIIRSGDDPDLAQAFERVVHARERLANLVFKDPESSDLPGIRRMLDDARRERDDAEDALAGLSATFRHQRVRVGAGCDAVQRQLPEGHAMVAYVRFDRYPTGRNGDVTPWYLAFVMTASRSRPVVVDLGPAAEVDRLVAEWRARNGRPPASDDPPETVNDRLRLSRELRRRIWDPAASMVTDAATVLIVPDGTLNLVNLSALIDDEGRYLLESGPTLLALPAERDLIRHRDGAAAPDGLLAIGNPDFETLAAPSPGGQAAEGAASPRPHEESPFAPGAAGNRPSTRGGRGDDCPGLAALRFDPLPATRDEVSAITDLWRALEGGAARSATALTGDAATETAFKTAAPGHRVLHVATHGFFLAGSCVNPGEPPASRTRGAGRVGPRRAEPPAPAVQENPLLRCGFALAGANRRNEVGPDRDDGILSAMEIAALDLSGVDLAVLSACDTGVGEIKAGEGVLGLQRAFLTAGARSVVMSLWPVADEETREWMGAFYRARFESGLDTAEAARAAARHVLGEERARGQGAYPFHWAGFVAAGWER